MDMSSSDQGSLYCTSVQSYDVLTPTIAFNSQNPHIGGPGRPGAQLTEEQLCSVQRFFPCRLKDLSSVDRDTIGFFIAKFVKKK